MKAHKILMYVLFMCCAFCGNAYSVALIYSNDFEDCTTDYLTTSGYVAYMNVHRANSECISSYNADEMSQTWTAHGGSGYLMTNDSGDYAMSPSVPGITQGNEYSRINMGLNETYCGTTAGTGCATDRYLTDITTNEIFISVWARFNSGYETIGDGDELHKFFRVHDLYYADPLRTIYMHIVTGSVGNDDGHMAFYCSGDDGWLGSSVPLVDLFDGNWHKLSFYINYDSGIVSGWYDVTTPTALNTTKTWTATDSAIGDATQPNYVVMQSNFSAHYPTEETYHAIDDVEVWDGMPGGVTCSDYDGNSSGCATAECVYCTDSSTCGAVECCGDDPLECDEAGCGTSWPSYYWCTDVCQVSTCSEQTLTVTKTGTGSGTLISDPIGINCGSTCNYDFTESSNVVVSAFADVGSSFTLWSVDDCDSEDGNECTVAMGTSPQSVEATFTSDSPSCSATNFFACLNQTTCEAESLYWWDGACRTITEPTDTIGSDLASNGDFADWTTGMPDDWSTYSNTAGIEEDTYGCSLSTLDTDSNMHIYQSIPTQITHRYSFNIITITGSVELWTEAEGSTYWTTIGTKTGLISGDRFYLQVPSGAIENAIIDNFVLKEFWDTPSIQITGSVIIQ